MQKSPRFSPEVIERAVGMVFDAKDQDPSQWAAIESIAGKIGCTAETLRKWVRQGERDSGVRPGATTAEQQRIKELEREVRELRKTTEEAVEVALARLIEEGVVKVDSVKGASYPMFDAATGSTVSEV